MKVRRRMAAIVLKKRFAWRGEVMTVTASSLYMISYNRYERLYVPSGARKSLERGSCVSF